jgi:hypothetical protein
MLDAAVPNVELHLFGSGNHGGGSDGGISCGRALPFSADIHLNMLNHSYDRTYMHL